jgi:hypothetical protein
MLMASRVPEAWAQGAGGLRITVKEGEGAINNIRLGRAKEPVIEVTDAENRPVRGASVAFVVPELGAGGMFPEGSTMTVVTDANGIAIGRGLRPNNVVGQFEIRVVASHQGQVARAVVTQTNVAPAKSGNAGKTALILALIGGGGAAVALGVTRGGKTSAQPSNPSTVITVGSSTFQPPR